MNTLSLELPDADATEALGARLAQALDGGLVIHLNGELGAGKTCLVRGLLRALGHGGKVKSPTYTLVEPYEIGTRHIFHFDLYRLADAEELEFMGIRDFLEPSALLLIEWPQRGAGVLPAPDLDCTLEYAGHGRHATLRACSERATHLLTKVAV